MLLPVDREELQVFNHEQLTMRLKIPSEFTWAYPYDDDGVHFAMSDGRVLALVGYGGKGLCDEEMPAPEVQLPPFGP